MTATRKKALPPRRSARTPAIDTTAAINQLNGSLATSYVDVRHAELIPLAVCLAIGQRDPRLNDLQRCAVWNVYLQVLKAIDQQQPGLAELLALDQLDEVDAVAELDEQTGCVTDFLADVERWDLTEVGAQS